MKKEKIQVRGIVQGVGFRPFVCNLASSLELGGYVMNTPDGVTIEVAGDDGSRSEFIRRLKDDAPPLALILDIRRDGSVPVNQDTGRSFRIVESGTDGSPRTLISPDTAVCDDCLNELFDPNDRRYRYPFINCTNCGPRFTIIRSLPYDRPNTTMSSFTMCPDCAREYADHRDRRFHAQPDACDVCGPHVSLLEPDGTVIDGDPVINAIDLLHEGKILAIKGLGGFHLAVDAHDEKAVNRLRQRKRRFEKPLAVMTGNLASARTLTILSDKEESLLTGRERPIVLARAKRGGAIAPSVAPGNPYLGVMLPYTPLHYLLFFDPLCGGDYRSGRTLFDALVMTSGNLSEEPICRTNKDALDRLGDIADAFLVHNRDIHIRCDDSVVTSFSGEPVFVRRSRGYVPVPVFMYSRAPQILAAGPELKNTVCITDASRAFPSQHIGDLENSATLDLYREAIGHFSEIHELSPRILAHDLHPRYLSTQYVMDRLDEQGIGTVGVQHHHAHIAGVLGEHGEDGPVIGLALDGTGYGLDGTVWGGEILVSTAGSFTRAGHFAYMPLPGGEKAIREPWRMAFAYLRAAFGEKWRDLDLPCLKQTSLASFNVLEHACERGINAPLTSSCGRLFDAVSSLLDISHTVSFEGQAAYLLELKTSLSTDANVFAYNITDREPVPATGYPLLGGTLADATLPEPPDYPYRHVIDVIPMVLDIVEGLNNGIPASRLAASFHRTVTAALCDVVDRIANYTGIHTVALSGGCFQNRILSERLPAFLRDRGYTVLMHRLVPVNDGGVSFGQACVASAVAGVNGL